MSLYELNYPWQKNIIDKFLYKKSFGLFLDMGLGKTLLALTFAEQHQCEKVIVITLNSKAIEDENISGSWLYWANKSSMNYKLSNKFTKEFSNQQEVFVINYESLFRRDKNKKESVMLKESIINFIKSCQNHNVALIVDESHKMKSLHSLQTKAIVKIKNELMRMCISSNKELYTYLLTGTPFTTGYIDLYSQLKILGYDENKSVFIDKYCIKGNIPGLLGWQQPIVGYKNVNELYRLVHKYALTIKSEDIVNLPEQIFIEHLLPETKDFKLFTHSTLQNEEIVSEYEKRNFDTQDIRNQLSLGNKKVNNPFFRNIDYPSFSYLSETNGIFWLRARQLSIGFQGNAQSSQWFDKSRLEAVKSFLIENKDNYVLFYNFTPELLELYDICNEAGYNVDVYCGEIKSLYHYDKFSKMLEEEKLQNHNNIILANFASGSTGKNWQEYSHCIIFSLPVYKDYSQALKRVHRLGQKHTVFYHTFYQENWLDKGMYKALNEQIDYTSDMFSSDLSRIQQLTNK